MEFNKIGKYDESLKLLDSGLNNLYEIKNLKMQAYLTIMEILIAEVLLTNVEKFGLDTNENLRREWCRKFEEKDLIVANEAINTLWDRNPDILNALQGKNEKTKYSFLYSKKKKGKSTSMSKRIIHWQKLVVSRARALHNRKEFDKLENMINVDFPFAKASSFLAKKDYQSLVNICESIYSVTQLHSIAHKLVQQNEIENAWLIISRCLIVLSSSNSPPTLESSAYNSFYEFICTLLRKDESKLIDLVEMLKFCGDTQLISRIFFQYAKEVPDNQRNFFQRVNPHPKTNWATPKDEKEKAALIFLVEHYLSLPSVYSIDQAQKDKNVKKMILWMEKFAYLPPKAVVNKEICDMSISLSLARALFPLSGKNMATQILEDGMKLPWFVHNAPHLTQKEKSVMSSPRYCLSATLLEFNGVDYGLDRLPSWRKLGDNSINSLLVSCIYKLSDNNQIDHKFLSSLNADLKSKVLYYQKVRQVFIKDRDCITKQVLRLGQSRSPFKVNNSFFFFIIVPFFF